MGQIFGHDLRKRLISIRCGGQLGPKAYTGSIGAG